MRRKLGWSQGVGVPEHHQHRNAQVAQASGQRLAIYR